MPSKKRIIEKTGTYLAEIETYKEKGEQKERVIRYLCIDEDGVLHRTIKTSDVQVDGVKQFLHIQLLHSIACEIGLNSILGKKHEYILPLVYARIIENFTSAKNNEWMNDKEVLDLLNIRTTDLAELDNMHLYIDSLDWISISKKIAKHWFAKHKEHKGHALLHEISNVVSENDVNNHGILQTEMQNIETVKFALAVTGKNAFPLMVRMSEPDLPVKENLIDFIKDIQLLGMQNVVVKRVVTTLDGIAELESKGIQCLCGIDKKSQGVPELIESISRSRFVSERKTISVEQNNLVIESYPFRHGTLILIFSQLENITQHRKKEQYHTLLYNASLLNTEEAIHHYFRNDNINKSFAFRKNLQSLESVESMSKVISGCLKISYLSYCILALLGSKLAKTGISASEAIEELSKIYRVHLQNTHGNVKWTKIVEPSKKQQKIIKATGIMI